MTQLRDVTRCDIRNAIVKRRVLRKLPGFNIHIDVVPVVIARRFRFDAYVRSEIVQSRGRKSFGKCFGCVRTNGDVSCFSSKTAFN
jgi:hypothetical protein